MWKFKFKTAKDKWIFLLTMGVILMILAFPAEKYAGFLPSRTAGSALGRTGSAVTESEASVLAEADTEVSGGAAEVSAKPADSYESRMEQRVREILKNVEGVGAVDVMIVLKSSEEKVYQADVSTSSTATKEQDSSGGVRDSAESEERLETILIGSGENSSPVLQKEIEPEISGIVISAEGGDRQDVKAEISEAMEALFGLPAHKIKVLKRVV